MASEAIGRGFESLQAHQPKAEGLAGESGGGGARVSNAVTTTPVDANDDSIETDARVGRDAMTTSHSSPCESTVVNDPQILGRLRLRLRSKQGDA